MITEYKRDMYHNYVVIYDENSSLGDYYEKVLTYNEILGHLTFECRMIDNKKYAYYEICGLQALSSIFEKHTVLYTELKQIFNSIIQGINAGKEYLLIENDYLLYPDMIFFDITKFEVKLCYYPGYGKSLRMQFHDLFEYFMNKVNYNDQAAVLLIYKLYMKCKNESCTIQQLLDILNEEISVNEHKERSNNESNEGFTKGKKGMDPINEEQNTDHIDYTIRNKKEDYLVKNNKREFIKELSNDVNGSINKIYHKLPFVSERVEEEKEVLYYPLSCYIICMLSSVVCISIYIFALRKGYLFQEFGLRIDAVKNTALIIVLIMIVVYVFIKVFDKKHKIHKIVPKINYIDPSLSTFDMQDSKKVQYNEGNIARINPGSRDSYWKQEQYQEDKMHEDKMHESKMHENKIHEDERTIMLNNFLNQKEVSLIPMNHDTYETIRIKAFPFFVGKLKTHIDVQIPSPAISRFHAKILMEENEYFIVDLNSTNGTFVDGDMLESYKKRKIEHGNKISFANINYIFNCT